MDMKKYELNNQTLKKALDYMEKLKNLPILLSSEPHIILSKRTEESIKNEMNIQGVLTREVYNAWYVKKMKEIFLIKG